MPPPPPPPPAQTGGEGAAVHAAAVQAVAQAGAAQDAAAGPELLPGQDGTDTVMAQQDGRMARDRAGAGTPPSARRPTARTRVEPDGAGGPTNLFTMLGEAGHDQ